MYYLVDVQFSAWPVPLRSQGRSEYLTWSGAVSVLWTVSTISCILPGCPTHWSDRSITIELQCFWLSSVTSLCTHLFHSIKFTCIYIYISILWIYTLFDLIACRLIFFLCVFLLSYIDSNISVLPLSFSTLIIISFIWWNYGKLQKYTMVINNCYIHVQFLYKFTNPLHNVQNFVSKIVKT